MTVDRLRELLAQVPGQARVETYNVDMTGFVIEDDETETRWLVWLPWREDFKQDGWTSVIGKPRR